MPVDRIRQGCHGSRLQQEQLPVRERPLDVLRPPEMSLDSPSQLGDRESLIGIHGLFDHALAPRGAASNRPLIADGFATDEPLSQTSHRGDHGVVPVAGERVGGERHSRSVGVDHRLHQHRHLSGRVPVRGDARRGRRSSAGANRVGKPVALHVEVRLVQAGVRRVRKILC